MGISHCRVSYEDSDHVEHAIEVEAESLYEAVALAVAEFRQDEVNPSEPGIMAEFTVLVRRKPIEHKIRLKHVHDWAQPSVAGGPVAILKREKVRKFLGVKP